MPRLLHQVLKGAKLKRRFVWQFCYVSAIRCRKPFLTGRGAKLLGEKPRQEHGTGAETSVLPNSPLPEHPAQSMGFSAFHRVVCASVYLYRVLPGFRGELINAAALKTSPEGCEYSF